MTTIRISDETLNELKELGLRNDSYEKILRMLIDDFKKYSPRHKAITELKAVMEDE
jgi:predicted CopG family antitoxin